MIIIKIVEYATFMEQSGSMWLIWLFIEVCQNKQQQLTTRVQNLHIM